MNSARCLTLAAIAALALFPPPCAHAALTDALVGLYEFESSFLDTSGSPQASHGTPVNSPGFTAGKIGQAMSLTGLRDYMSLNPATLTELDFGSPTGGDAVDFSVSMWVRQSNALSDPAVFSNKNWNSGDNTGINWAVKGNGIFDLNTKADIGLRRDLDTAANSAQTPVGAWNLVVMTVERSAATRLYINGVNTGTIPATSQGDFNGGLPWNVGQDGTGQYGIEFTGAVDELAIWRRAITPAEASQLWNGGAGLALGSMVVETRLKLVVDRDTGRITLENNTGAAQPIAGYQITSAAGSLNRSGWTPIAGRLDDAGNGTIDADDNWVAFTAPGAVGDLSEGSLDSGVIPAGATIDLGLGAWEKYYRDAEDLEFLYADATSDEPLAGLVEFIGNHAVSFPLGDLDFDGVLGPSDWSTLAARFSGGIAPGLSTAQAYRRGDLNGDGRHSLDDVLAFRLAYDAAHGAGAFANMTGVPEPAGAVLGMIAFATVKVIGRRKQPTRFAPAPSPWRGWDRPTGDPKSPERRAVAFAKRSGRGVAPRQRMPARSASPLPNPPHQGEGTGRFSGESASLAPFKFNQLRVLLFAACLLTSFSKSHAAVLFQQNFNGVELGESVDETPAADDVWTGNPPIGWTIDNSGVPAGGVTEWRGWSFADPDWWSTVAGDQERSAFTKASGAIAVADPDEWDDLPRTAGTYNTLLRTPVISLDGVAPGAAQLRFDSSWMPEDTQTATIGVSYNGAAPVEVLRWTSVGSDSTFKPAATNETVVVPLNNPAGALNVAVTFGMVNAENDWWWAIDNLFLLTPLTLQVDVQTGAMKLLGDPGVQLTAYEITSPGGSLNPAGWRAGNLDAQNVGNPHPHAADFDHNGTVAASDLAAWRIAHGATAAGDADGDGDTDGADFLQWQRSLGATSSPESTWLTLLGTNAQLIESYLLGSSNFPTDRPFGAGYDAAKDLRDLTFTYTTLAGEKALGAVSYVNIIGATPVPEPAAAALSLVAVVALLHGTPGARLAHSVRRESIRHT